MSLDNKLEQLKLQHKIFQTLQKDNGVSSHFDYHINLVSDTDTVKLNLLTFNQRHNEYMLFHTVSGKSSLDCLRKMLDYINQQVEGPDANSYTIRWNKKGDSQVHLSYFMADNEEEAIQKFLHEKQREDYEFSCSLNPVS